MNRHTPVPSALRTLRLILSEAAPDAGAPLPSHDSKFDALKSLAKRDLPTLRHLAALKKVHDSQANLTGKDASLAIQAILNRLDQVDPAAAAQLGQKNWEPNALSWIELFDTIGDQKLGEYIGIKDHASIPTGSAIEAGTDDEPVAPANDDGEEGTAAPEGDEDGTGDTDEVEALLKKPAPEAKPSSATRESHARTIKRITEAGDDGYTSIDDIVASHGDRKVVAFIHNRHQERVPFNASLEDALYTFEQYGGDVADIISDWKTVESYGDLAQYVRGQQPERGSEED
jgi:hypothetical protein